MPAWSNGDRLPLEMLLEQKRSSLSPALPLKRRSLASYSFRSYLRSSDHRHHCYSTGSSSLAGFCPCFAYDGVFSLNSVTLNLELKFNYNLLASVVPDFRWLPVRFKATLNWNCRADVASKIWTRTRAAVSSNFRCLAQPASWLSCPGLPCLGDGVVDRCSPISSTTKPILSCQGLAVFLPDLRSTA